MFFSGSLGAVTEDQKKGQDKDEGLFACHNVPGLCEKKKENKRQIIDPCLATRRLNASAKTIDQVSLCNARRMTCVQTF